MDDQHRIQIRVDDDGWARAQRAATENGLSRVSKLCELLLNREYIRLGIDKEFAEPLVVGNGDAEHRIQIRVKEGQWARVKVMAAAKGFETISDLCRNWLEKELERFEMEGKTTAKTPRGIQQRKKSRRGRR